MDKNLGLLQSRIDEKNPNLVQEGRFSGSQFQFQIFLQEPFMENTQFGT